MLHPLFLEYLIFKLINLTLFIISITFGLKQSQPTSIFSLKRDTLSTDVIFQLFDLKSIHKFKSLKNYASSDLFKLQTISLAFKFEQLV